MRNTGDTRRFMCMFGGEMATEGSPSLLEMRDISKSFPGVRALSSVSFRLRSGEVMALMGENGAGKSTLIKVLTGVYEPDAGAIILAGHPIHPESPLHAQSLGISTVYQEVNLCSNLTVAENIFIGREPKKRGLIDWKGMKAGAEALLLDKLNVRLDASQLLSSYSIAIQQMVAIGRALFGSSKILILDEPTSSLDEAEVAQLFKVMRKLKNEGLAILFVTHFIDQTYEVSDRITVLRNGELVGEFATSLLPRTELIAKMIGKEYMELERTLRGTETDERRPDAAYLRLNSFGKANYLTPLDQSFFDHEVVGVAGLLGSGRTELARLLFGIERADQGEYVLKGRKKAIGSPAEAIAADIGFCPEDRKAEGLLDELTIRENIILALQARNGMFKHLTRKRQEAIALEYVSLLSISTPDVDRAVKTLSGGNQQKVILARWLVMAPHFLILDEPTRGIDVGAKAEIQKLILQLRDEGMSILFISSEIEEIARCSDRVMVLRDRAKIGELRAAEVNEQAILHVIAKGDENVKQA